MNYTYKKDALLKTIMATMSTNPKLYQRNIRGQVIGEGDTQRGDNVVRYIYSGNQKVAMVRK
ncbi:hypothetical protein EBR57_08425, partial [bacterium]|nr:hypothetical protein [bacterium]